MPKPTLAEQWATFEQKTGIYKTGSIQRQEMRRAFYAGAAALMDVMLIGLDPDKEPTDADMKYMDSLEEEIRQFGKDVAAGKA